MRTRVNLGGFSGIVTVIEQACTPNVIGVSGGELNGTRYFSGYKGEPDFLVFNAFGLNSGRRGGHGAGPTAWGTAGNADRPVSPWLWTPSRAPIAAHEPP